jgi:hypothetical protein
MIPSACLYPNDRIDDKIAERKGDEDADDKDTRIDDVDHSKIRAILVIYVPSSAAKINTELNQS